MPEPPRMGRLCTNTPWAVENSAPIKAFAVPVSSMPEVDPACCHVQSPSWSPRLDLDGMRFAESSNTRDQVEAAELQMRLRVHPRLVRCPMGLALTCQLAESLNLLMARKGSLKALVSRRRPKPALLSMDPRRTCLVAKEGAGVLGNTHPGPRPPKRFCIAALKWPVMRSPSIWLSPQW